MSTVSFVWDSNKNSINIMKHGISFDEAQSVFHDEYARLLHDSDHSEDEERFLILGFSKNNNIVVCYCYLEDNEVVRIISARKATKNEKKEYQEFKL